MVHAIFKKSPTVHDGVSLNGRAVPRIVQRAERNLRRVR
jgi:hypothetical protein